MRLNYFYARVCPLREKIRRAAAERVNYACTENGTARVVRSTTVYFLGEKRDPLGGSVERLRRLAPEAR